jgi:hypothetical protein
VTALSSYTTVTKDSAISTARNAVERFGKPFVIYRLAAWPPDVYGVIAEDRGLPPAAEIFATIGREGAQPVKGQGALF